MRKLFIFSALLFILFGCSKENVSGPKDHLRVYGLGLGASVKKVTSELGVPKEKHVSGNYVIYRYSNLYLGFKKERLVFISSEDPEFSTDKGIHINDDKRKVLLKYKDYKIFCKECSREKIVSDFEHLPEFFYIEDGDIRMVFGGEGSKIDFMQVGKDLPKNMMFVHNLNPEKENKMTSEEMDKKSVRIEKDLISKLVKQYSNSLKVKKVKFTKDRINKNLKEMASQGKLPGLPYQLGTSYKNIINPLGAPDKSGVLGEGSYNLIYGNFDLAFDYRDLYGEHKNPDTKVIVLTQTIDAPIVASNMIDQLGDPEDYNVDMSDGTGYLTYQIGDYTLTIKTNGEHTKDASIHDDDVVSLELKLSEKQNESSSNDFNARYDFQATGTDGKEYKLYIYSENEESSTINTDDVWYSEWLGAPKYSGEYTVALEKGSKNKIEKQKVGLGENTFVPQDKTSTASMIYSENGPDVLLITQKDSASFTNYKTYIIKNGELKEISFVYKGNAMEDLYLEGFRNNTSSSWESLTFSQNSNNQWLVTVWKLDLEAEVFRNVKETEYSTNPW